MERISTLSARCRALAAAMTLKHKRPTSAIQTGSPAKDQRALPRKRTIISQSPSAGIVILVRKDSTQ